MAEALRRAAAARRLRSRSTTASSSRASTAASASPTSPAVHARRRQARQAPARRRSRDLLVERRPGSPTAAGASSAWRWPRSASDDLVRRAGPRPRRQHDPLLDEGLDELAAVVEGCARADADRVAVVADLSIARGLDYYTGTVYETRLARATSSWARSAPAAATTPSPATAGTTYPGVGISLGRHPAARAAARPRAARPPTARCRPCVLVALTDEEPGRPSPTRSPQRAARAAASPPRWRRGRAEVRQADPVRRAARHPVRLVPRRRRRPPGQGHPQRRAGRRRPGRPGPRPGRGPAADRSSRPAPTAGADTVIRTHDAGTLRAEHVGRASRSPAGWPAAATTAAWPSSTCATPPASSRSSSATRTVAHDLRSEYCLQVTGEVVRRARRATRTPTAHRRDRGHRRPRSRCSARPRRCRSRSTSHVERRRGGAAALPLPRPAPRRARPRRCGCAAEVNQAARDVLDDHGFVEVETPTLTRSTPEGARDFLVPARLQPGSWYALPQCPAAVQAAADGRRAWSATTRSPAATATRTSAPTGSRSSPSSTSRCASSTRTTCIELGEEVVGGAVAELAGHEIPPPLPRMTYAEAMARYGSDKPDLRFGQRARRPAPTTSRTPRSGCSRRGYVGAVVMPGGAGADPQGARRLAGVGQAARRPGPGLRAGRGGRRARRPGRQEPLRGRSAPGWPAHVGAEPGDCVFFAAGAGATAARAARRGPPGDRPPLRPDRRVAPGRSLGRRRAAVRAERRATGRAGRARAPPVHLARHAEWIDRFDDDPGEALAYAYDIVCNGNEIGGGSIRIHRADVQQRVFDVHRASREEEAEEKFGFLLDAFKYGPPPHGGIAFGWDRHLRAARRRRLDPRRDRVPEDRRRASTRSPARRRRSRRSSATRPASTPPRTGRSGRFPTCGALGDAEVPHKWGIGVTSLRPKRSWRRRSGAGAHQFQSPSRRHGRRAPAASAPGWRRRATATARPTPICLMTSISPAAKPANTMTMTSAAEVMIRPLRCRPDARRPRRWRPRVVAAP